ncbi:unnamed protein product (macronuclear) [Paramecium tetraurelia]|uniref:Chromosome undetermined scaffold_1, whole genome shotgun sequence n=1 Tax=Paramecium tetraurelia TaxID=5888 RepID=Q6BFT6_PARTE|nr:hypothetical protein [Paramecium tetraurelia strain d4-2]XP_001423179.1 uncharacterized protein GSPATT00000216001 [Paramecium tetraurelia]CAH03484.1 hypothetical protein, RNA recognition motif [Paramecium tetraurelia]CAK55781.1 unnamed protein product [Paramecium tetraurelia]|eukprot:XP_001423179.1 hypothetical protein (macronuclear) [Paramecium tetraurelia strain d4-2]
MSRQQFRNARMSLFVGNISRLVEQKDIEREFKVHGDCTVDFRVKNNDRYAFIQYKSEQEAEAAKNALHQRDLQGIDIGFMNSERIENKYMMRIENPEEIDQGMTEDNQEEIMIDSRERGKRKENQEGETQKVEAEVEVLKIEVVHSIECPEVKVLIVRMNLPETKCQNILCILD